jgi:hypothetical protein
MVVASVVVMHQVVVVYNVEQVLVLIIQIIVDLLVQQKRVVQVVIMAKLINKKHKDVVMQVRVRRKMLNPMMRNTRNNIS